MPSLLYKSLTDYNYPRFSTQFLNVSDASPPSSPPPNRNLSCRITSQSMSCSSETPFPTLRTVTIPYYELKDKDADLSLKIEEGFGPNGLGILSITDVPEFPSLRRNLLCLSSRLAALPEDVKKELEDPQSRYNFGWSHGKEQLESGKPDLLKGSFYANPLIDVPTNDTYLIQRYPSYCGANIWPLAALPELEVAFKALGKLIFDVGLMVAYHCDQYVSRGMKMQKDEGLEEILLRSRCHKGRLLYYFPAQLSNHEENGDSMSSWCGWHTDHGSLTGLTCAMFKRNDVEISCPDSAAGLYIRTRSGEIVKATFGENEIAYQIGETTEILSQGYLCATPHGVRAPKGKEASVVDRSTFALFMQPDWYVNRRWDEKLNFLFNCRDEKLKFSEDVYIHKEVFNAEVLLFQLIPSNDSLTFGEYSEMLLDKYYHKKT
ncbi:hypothetical protein Goshw_003589 [Gossypium schwendimanii]|uniref:Fe2OG dioxygenase domain-containing protein n=1 Tax=Gossypium schwendimanii TaxID=34291 RepID=A0A7J9M9X9_GOSSC|nr:hypothetical protein [Gossypium schwendimanii]